MHREHNDLAGVGAGISAGDQDLICEPALWETTRSEGSWWPDADKFSEMCS